MTRETGQVARRRGKYQRMVAARDGGQQVAQIEQAGVALRLMRRRKARGFPSAKAFALANGFKPHTYMQHESGRQAVGLEAAKVYAERLEVSVVWLLFGNLALDISHLPVVGVLAQQGKVQAMGRSAKRIKPLPAPVLEDTSELVMHLVADDSLFPFYRSGDLVLHRPLDQIGFRVQKIHGLECIVRLADGSELLRWVHVQTDGRVALNIGNLPPQYDCDIIAGEAIRLTIKAQPEQQQVPFYDRGDPAVAA